ncbi:hypothetical protein GTW43_13280 [Streptomyces sp. SID5785]|uniref:hypothetical protein n=1 Tax=Streptomyces sp. SID5785 TaxID=2690309 RepID=UPI0013614062|nr:hypothetical protein [Streptomyces sp. SID5785]MZD06054.1 hypothetical protein [Streptomyces sp. SID5785]
MLAVALVAGGLAVLLGRSDGGPDGGAGACRGRQVSSWRDEPALTQDLARYGDDAARTDDWSGGDGTHSVRLPDGRVLWLFSDTFLGAVHGPPNLAGEPHAWRDAGAPFVRNSAVVTDRSGRLGRTVAAPLFPDTGVGEWRWPVAARVEPRTAGAREQVVRVLLWTRARSGGPYVYGVPAATEVATLSLPDLRLEGVTQVLDQRQVPDPARRVLFGTAAVDAGRWTYVFGADDGQAPAHRAYAARAPRGRLGDVRAWEYWDGARWRSGARPAPVLGDGRRRGVGSAFTVVRDAGTYVLFTTAAGPAGLSAFTSYWSCSPVGPWHGPAKGFTASLPDASVAAYNPQAHPALGAEGRLVLSYDVNRLDAAPGAGQDALNRNVARYRPRFVSVRLGPAP